MELKELQRETVTVDGFVHLHLHSIYSALDGTCKPEDVAKKANELAMPAVAVTDHNHLGGTLEFQRACKKVGIKPILGFEAYMTHNEKIASLPIEGRKLLSAFCLGHHNRLYDLQSFRSAPAGSLRPNSWCHAAGRSFRIFRLFP